MNRTRSLSVLDRNLHRSVSPGLCVSMNVRVELKEPQLAVVRLCDNNRIRFARKNRVYLGEQIVVHARINSSMRTEHSYVPLV